MKTPVTAGYCHAVHQSSTAGKKAVNNLPCALEAESLAPRMIQRDPLNAGETFSHLPESKIWASPAASSLAGTPAERSAATSSGSQCEGSVCPAAQQAVKEMQLKSAASSKSSAVAPVPQSAPRRQHSSRGARAAPAIPTIPAASRCSRLSPESTGKAQTRAMLRRSMPSRTGSAGGKPDSSAPTNPQPDSFPLALPVPRAKEAGHF